MEAAGRCVYILFLQLCLFYITSTDPASPINVPDIRNFQAHIVADFDKCNLKIKITDPKYSSSLDEPSVVSKSSDLEGATSTPSYGSTGIPGTDGKKGANGEPGVKGEKGDLGERGVPGVQGPKGETGERGEKAENGIKGDRGDKGDPGEHGIQGIQGPQGENGTNGEKGENGTKGDRGDKGDPGERGIQGIQGPQGENGTNGEKGENGMKGDRGDKGDTGERGIQGEKGDRGPAGEDCGRGLLRPEETEARIGDVARPAKSCADINETGVATINPINSFTVYCNIEKSEMCLYDVLIDHDLDESELEENSRIFHTEPFWINLHFKNTYTLIQSQIAYLLSQSSGVRQKIKYYCMNNEVIPMDNTKSLLLSLWSGQLVGPAPSRETPINYIVQDDTCNQSNNTWESAVIKMETNFTNVLPILDIYIQDIRIGKKQKYHIELEELCFSYKKPVRRH